jgi:DNA-binding LacI/PurR family transcriptional regulator
MPSSAEVAVAAGVSRSTVSQIINGHGHRFTPEMVEHVQETASRLGYRPSVAGRALVRGTSDIVITVIPNITFGPRLRELIDLITAELALAGITNLLRFATSEAALEDAILGLRPRGLWSVAPIPPQQRARLEAEGVTVIEQSQELQVDIDHEIGALQAAHLASRGYQGVVVSMPLDLREQPFAIAREEGARAWCQSHGVPNFSTLHLDLTEVGVREVASALPPPRVGIAAYNDEVALAMMSAANLANRDVPESLGIVGVDDSTIARIAVPTLTTVTLDVEFSAHEIVRGLLEGPEMMPTDPLPEVAKHLRVVQGGSS